MYVSDVKGAAARFCAEQFRATMWLSDADIATVSAPRSFDLIWSGSLITHLSEADSALVLAKFHDWRHPAD